MPLASLATRTPPGPAQAAKDRSSPGKVTGKLKRAVDAMVYDGLTRRQAAEQAGLSEFSLYIAFRKQHVLAYFKAQLEVLRSSEQARNIHALLEVRDQQTNQMARVQAVKALEQLADEPSSHANKQALPGLVVQINVGPGTALTHAQPLTIDNADGSTT